MRGRRASWTGETHAVSVEINGVKHDGYYQIDAGMIRVSNLYGEKVTQLGGSASAPKALAMIMLSELVRESPKV